MNVVSLMTPPVDVPVTVTVTPDTTRALAAAVSVNVDVAAGLAGVMGLGVNPEAVTPVGRPPIESVTVWTPVPVATSRADTVDAELVVPWTIETLVGATLRL